MDAPLVLYEGPVVTRKSALIGGLRYYFTGRPCSHGHIAQRQLPKSMCVECAKIRARSPRKRAQIAAFRANNKDRIAKSAKEWRRKNPTYFQKYREKNRIITALTEQRRRARKKLGGYGVVTKEFIETLRKSGRCYICNKKFGRNETADIEHVVALSAGGKHEPSNIALAHHRCNMIKGPRRMFLI